MQAEYRFADPAAKGIERTMTSGKENLPEKARLLVLLKEAGFSVPPFLYMPAEDFERESFASLKGFLQKHCGGFKIITRSCHPGEEFYKGGTFDSLDTYADPGGVKYARNRIIKSAREDKRLSIRRQQKFQGAPPIDLEDTGIMVMPFIEGTSVMAKIIGDHWEFGYSRSRDSGFANEPYITNTPHDLRLLTIAQDVETLLGFRCEIEYVVSREGEIFVVQAKDISKIETLEHKESKRSIRLDGLRRIRKRRNYRERPIYVMDNRSLYLQIISNCEDIVHGCVEPVDNVEEIIARVAQVERDMEEFALRHERFCVVGLSIEVPEDLYQVVNHYLDDTPELQQQISKSLYRNQYMVDRFLAETDTLLAQDKFRRNLCSHDAYGINTVRSPIWLAYWSANRHREVVDDFRGLGYRTGDYVGIELDDEDRPLVYRL